MKAKEYFEKYETLILTDASTGEVGHIKQLLYDLSGEAQELCKSRKAVTDDAAIAVLKEQDQKWNAICSLYKKKYDSCPVPRNMFKKFWIHLMPELKTRI